MSEQDQEVFQLFLEESAEYLEDIESLLLEAEEGNRDEDTVNTLFRAVHTIKGGAGFFNLDAVNSLAHAMEDMLGQVRDKTIPFDDRIITTLIAGRDLLAEMISAPDEADTIPSAAVLEEIQKIMDNPAESDHGGTPPATGAGADYLTLVDRDGRELLYAAKKALKDSQEKSPGGPNVYLLCIDLQRDIEQKHLKIMEVIKELESLLDIIESRLIYDPADLGHAPAEKDMNLQLYILCSTVMDLDLMQEFTGLPGKNIVTVLSHTIRDRAKIPDTMETDFTGEPATPEKSALSRHAESAAETSAAEKKPSAKAGRQDPLRDKQHASPSSLTGTKDRSIRIGLKSIDRLMNLAAELVLTRNEFLTRIGGETSTQLAATAHRLDEITGEIQDAVMQTRMQSVGIVLKKFKRVVRDLSAKLDKEIDLTITGTEVELDRTIIEAIGDPLTHLVRNSVDHGIEMPDVRQRAGKEVTGKITLAAVQETDNVRIEIRDDGAGMDTEKIGTSAVKKGICTAQELAQMSADEIRELIFSPGFSTAEEISDLSGRGVGMDVVKQSIAKVGGIIRISSEVGRGTTTSIKLPLTLAIIPGLLVRLGTSRFAIPQNNVIKLLRIPADRIQHEVYRVGDSASIRFKDQLIPVVSLGRILEIPSQRIDAEGTVRPDRRSRIADRRSPHISRAVAEDLPAAAEENRRSRERRRAGESHMRIAVVQSEESIFGLIVDALDDSEEIVVKHLGAHLKNAPYYAGATILGDGCIALITDIDAIRQHPLVRGTSRDISRTVRKKQDSDETGPDRHDLLTFSNEGDPTHYAVPMDIVRRIIRISPQEVERVGTVDLIRSLGETIPLVRLSEALGTPPIPRGTKQLYCIIFNTEKRPAALAVTHIDDIRSITENIDTDTYRAPGIIGTTMIDDHLTAMVDLYEVLVQNRPDLAPPDTARQGAEKQTVLVVDDSPFFRKQMGSIVTDTGYTLITAGDGEEALEVLEKEQVDLVLTDIEMPRMNGLELTRKIRQGPKAHIPVVACTTLSKAEDRSKGYDAGVNEYLIKIDRTQVVQSCTKYLHGK
ncbi:MAG: chemotaxis protein CheW [Fibrobacterota bacterium]